MILKRGDFYRHYNNGLLKLEDDSVIVYPKPSGALCKVHRVGDTTCLINGEYRFVNSPLSDYLVNLGIEGEVLIHHMVNSRNVSKWLTYHHHHSQMEDWSKEIKLYVFGQSPNAVGHIPIETLHPLRVPVCDLRDTINRLSTDLKFDGLLIDAEAQDGPNRYFMVPTRYCDGVVNSIVDENDTTTLIIDINHRGHVYTTTVSSMTNRVREQIEGCRDSLIGKALRVQYTTFVPGDRLRNFSSPVGLFISE